MRIGEVIRKYRKEAGLTQEEMANRLGVTTPAVNKWENGNSNPDIELLAPIARLLHISLDTLMSFHEELTISEISDIIKNLDSMIESNGFEKAYLFAMEKVRDYPNCNQLIWQVAVILDARRLADACEDCEKYDKQINAWYEMALNDENEEVKRHAADSLFGFYLRKKEYAKAESYLQYYSDYDPMKKIYQGRLYKEQGETEAAYKAFESAIFEEYNILNFALSMMKLMAIEEKDISKARYFAGKEGTLARVLDRGKYNECSPMLDVVYAEKNIDGTYQVVEQLLGNVDSICDFRKSKLYEHMTFSEPNDAFLEDLKEKLLEGFRDRDAFGYMSGNADWEELFYSKRYDNCSRMNEE